VQERAASEAAGRSGWGGSVRDGGKPIVTREVLFHPSKLAAAATTGQRCKCPFVESPISSKSGSAAEEVKHKPADCDESDPIGPEVKKVAICKSKPPNQKPGSADAINYQQSLKLPKT
jgi:hypothetical protein